MVVDLVVASLSSVNTLRDGSIMQYVFLSSVVKFKGTGKRFCKACPESQVSTQLRGMLQ